MGEAEIILSQRAMLIHSHIICYGTAGNESLTEQIRDEMETLWNEPLLYVTLNGLQYAVRFRITAAWQPLITDLEIYRNTDPRNNYFRIEAYARDNISFVDGLGSNTGYFKLENLYPGSTTAAHEYGHTLGLDHPHNLDLRGRGRPGIMYPRGTLVDPEFQYDPAIPAGQTGGTLHPMHRRVQEDDISALQLHRLRFHQGKAVVGAFTNVYHGNHSEHPN